MEMKDHLEAANNYLDEAMNKINALDFKGAHACLFDAQIQTLKLHEHVQELIVIDASTPSPAVEDHK